VSIFKKAKPKVVTRRIPKVDVDGIAQKSLEEAVARLERDLMGTALRMLGFGHSQREGWFIDRVNGRVSMISELIQHRAKDIFTHMDLEKAFTLTEEETQQLRTAVRKAFLEAAEREVRGKNYNRDVIQAATQKLVHEEVELYLQETGARENVRAWIRQALGGEE
jgi:hypothetical protein